MKKLLLMLLATVFFTACNKDDQTPGNSLPEATQTGTGTFACYVDGNPYIAKKSEITAYYQFTQGYYAFSVSGAKKDKPLFGIHIGSSSDDLVVGNTYNLRNREIGNQWGGNFFCIRAGNSVPIKYH